MSNYITTANVTSTVLQDYNLSGYVNAANNHLDAYADSMGVGSGYIATPVHYLITEYLVAYACRLAMRDKLGTNNSDIAQDKYIIMYDIYNKEVERIRPYITQEVLENVATDIAAGARTTPILRS